MDHQEQHHLHHEKEREERIRHEKEEDRREEAAVRHIHPAWFVALGVLFIILIVLGWTVYG